jgi:hypothetical protein
MVRGRRTFMNPYREKMLAGHDLNHLAQLEQIAAQS